MAIKCSKCGTELPDGAVFCYNCGQSVQMTPKSNTPKTETSIPVPAPIPPKATADTSNSSEKKEAEATQVSSENPYYSKEKKKIPIIPIAIAAAAVLVIGIGVGAFFLIKGKGGDNKPGDKVAEETTTKKKGGLNLFSSGVDVTQIDGGKVKWKDRDEATMDTLNYSTEEDPLPEDYMVGTWLKCYENMAKDPNMNREMSDNQDEWRTKMGGRITFADDGTYIAQRWYLDNPDAVTTYSGKYFYNDTNNYEECKIDTYILILETSIDEYHSDPGAPELSEERLKIGFYATGLAKNKDLDDELLLSSSGSWADEGEPGQYYRKLTNDYHPELFDTSNLQVNALSEIEKNLNLNNKNEIDLLAKNDGTEGNEKGELDIVDNTSTNSGITFGDPSEDEKPEKKEEGSTNGGITLGDPGEEEKPEKKEEANTNGGITFGDSSEDEKSEKKEEANTNSGITFGDDNPDQSISESSTDSNSSTISSTEQPSTSPSAPPSGPGATSGLGGPGNNDSIASPAGADASPASKAVTGGKFDVLQSGETIYYLMNGQEAQDVWIREADKYYYIGFDKCLMYNNYASDGYYVGADGAWDKYIPRLTTTDKLMSGTYVYENGYDSVTWTFNMTPSGTYDGTAVRTYSFGYSENYGVSYKGGSCYFLEGNGIYGAGPQITVLDGGERFIITDYGYSDRFVIKR